MIFDVWSWGNHIPLRPHPLRDPNFTDIDDIDLPDAAPDPEALLIAVQEVVALTRGPAMSSGIRLRPKRAANIYRAINGALHAAPTPGSLEARLRGCKCPVGDNAHGKGTPRGFIISEGCAMHWISRP